MVTSMINDKVVVYDEVKKKWSYKISKQPLEAKVLEQLIKKLEAQEAEKKAKPVLAICLGNFGVPAKKRFFTPVDGLENKKVWPLNEKAKGGRQFVLAKDQQYNVHPRIMDNPNAKTMFKAVKSG